MRIFVDADACPVKLQVEQAARKYGIEVIYVVDYNHRITTDYGRVLTVDQGKDQVDLAIINQLQKGDVVITQDYGVASMALAKRAYGMNQNGLEYSPDNIDLLLMQRHESAKARRGGKRSAPIKKRTEEDDQAFLRAFSHLLSRIL